MLEQIIAQLNIQSNSEKPNIFKAEGETKSLFNQATEISKIMVETERDS